MPCFHAYFSRNKNYAEAEGKRVDCMDGNEDGKLRASILRKRFNIFLGGLRFAFNLGTTLAYFVVSGAQNTRKTKDNALRYLYTMLVVKMRRKKRGGWECSKVEREGWR